MKRKPMLFSGPMVRALLAGAKTQTRRKLDAWTDDPVAFVYAGAIRALDENESEYRWPRTHAVGDRLYVREHWRTGSQHDHIAPRDLPQEWAEPIGYIADEAPSTLSRTGRFRQGMHMPRWASRLTLTVTDVRVERLQDISDEDAQDEGVDRRSRMVRQINLFGATAEERAAQYLRACVWEYEALWNRINGEGAWEANPWVAAYTFTVELGNIDQLAGAT